MSPFWIAICSGIVTGLTLIASAASGLRRERKREDARAQAWLSGEVTGWKLEPKWTAAQEMAYRAGAGGTAAEDERRSPIGGDSWN